MAGINRFTGKRLTSIEDQVRQNIADIISTPIGSRVMRRDYGSHLPLLIDQPLNAEAVARLYVATATALLRWEPRFQISSIHLITPSSIDGGITELYLEGMVDGQSLDSRIPVTGVLPT